MKVKGTIERVFFTKGNWSSIAICTDKGKYLKCAGSIINPVEGCRVELEGEITVHPQYGEQLQVTSSSVQPAMTADSIINYLTSGFITGCGLLKAYDIYDMFGKKTLDVIENNPEQLTKVKGISDKTAKKIHDSHMCNQAYIKLVEYFKGEATENQILKIYEQYGKDSLDVIKKNPYRLIYDINGFGFKKVDKLAKSAGIAPDSVERMKACIAYTINTTISDNGNCYTTLQTLEQMALQTLVEIEEDHFNKELNKLAKKSFSSKEEKEKALKKAENENRNEILRLTENYKIKVLDAIVDMVRPNENDEVYLKEADSPLFECRKYFIYDFDETSKTYTLKNEFDSSIKYAKKEDFVFCRNDKLIVDDDRVYLPKFYIAEYDIALIIKRMLGRKRKCDEFMVNNIIAKKEKELGVEFDSKQKEAVKLAMCNGISSITGGPGMGKTTIIQLIIECWQSDYYHSIRLAAPTGKAAKRMMDVTGVKANTIHKLAYSFDEKILKRNVDEDCLFIFDESSMIDLLLAYEVLKLVHNGNAVFVGDIDQLPSVGAGSFFKDLIKSPFVPTVALEFSYRFGGVIAQNAKKINEGKAMVEIKKNDDFKYLKSNKEQIQEVIKSEYMSYIEAGLNPKDIAVLVPMRKTTSRSSVIVVNEMLRNIVNSENLNKKNKVMDTNFYLGDRILINSNNYKKETIMPDGTTELGVFNGDTGYISEVNNDDKEFVVMLDDGRSVICNKTDVATMELSYAMTIHKSQGSEYKACIIVQNNEHYIMLQRNALYTAVTRAKEYVSLLGDYYAFERAIGNIDPVIRNSYLQTRIRKVLMK